MRYRAVVAYILNRPIARGAMLAISVALILLALVPALASAQTPLADSIADAGPLGFQLVSSERVDFTELLPADASPEDVPEAWIKVFTDGTDGVGVTAIQFSNRDSLGAGLAGAMASTPPSDRQLHPTLEGVVVANAVLEGQNVRLAFYGEGTTGFVLTGFGQGRDNAVDRVLSAQLDYSAGGRYPLRVDENERYLEEIDRNQLANDIGRYGGLIAIVAAVGYWLIRSTRRRSEENFAPAPDPPVDADLSQD